MFWMIVCWFDDLIEIVVCDFYFSLQQSDVSTLKQEDDYCRNHLMSKMLKKENRLLIVVVADSLRLTDSKKEDRLLTEMSKTRERRSTIDCRLTRRIRRSTIDLLIEFWFFITIAWLTFRTRRSTIESFRRHEDALCKFFIQFTKIRFVTSWSSQRTWVERQTKYIHRLQRENFFILADSRSFSLTHDAHSGSEIHSSSAKTELRRLSFSKNFNLTILFCLLAYFDEQSVSKQKIWSSVS